MGAPLQVVNKTKKQFFMEGSGRFYDDETITLIKLFQLGIWEPTDEFVVGYHLTPWDDDLTLDELLDELSENEYENTMKAIREDKLFVGYTHICAKNLEQFLSINNEFVDINLEESENTEDDDNTDTFSVKI